MFTVVFLCFSWFSLLHARKPKECPPFPHAILPNGTISILRGQKLHFRCDPGYFLAAPSIVRCLRGKWTSTRTPSCIKIEGTCDEPPSIENGEIHGEDRNEGSTIQYMCKANFLLLGEGRRQCLSGGYWSGVTPACMDESEPLQKISERLKDKFISDLSSYSSNETTATGRLLDRESVHHGLELVILIDRSSSVDPEDFKIGVNFVKFLLQEFGVKNGNNTTGTRAAVISFGSQVDILFNLDNATITGPIAANRALDTLQSGGGGTAMELALTHVFTDVFNIVRERAKKAIFLITDGEPNIGTPGITPKDVAVQLKEAGGFEIFTLGVGRGINRKFLSDLASTPLFNHVFILDKYSRLQNIIKMIRDAPPKSKPISPEKCGYIKGESFYLKKWPWLAAIYISHPEGHLSFCSGTLICSQWVLTAASCFTEQTNSTEHEQVAFVTLGEKNLLKEEVHQLNFYAVKTILHPAYRPLHNDLALLQLNTPVPLKKFRPVCLPPTDRTVPLHLDLSINASIAGWGLETAANVRITSGTVHFDRTTVPVELATEHECRQAVGRTFAGNTFCAGSGNKTCSGDLGSPIVALDSSTNLHHMLGVLTRKKKCTRGFNQYTELTPHIPWINRVTNKCHLKHWIS